MSSRFGELRNRIVNAALGVELRELLIGYQQSLYRHELKQSQRDAEIAFISRRLHAELELLREARDNIADLKSQLADVRRSQEYERAFNVSEPLISVRIASYLKTDELMEIAISSVLAQSYQNFELIVVNDGPNESTRRAIKSLGDSRIRYEEFDRRSPYPSDSHARWMVAGSPGMNRGAALSNGVWIAPLDEDDSFTPDHLEKLVALARSEHVELAYGALVQKNLVNGDEHRIWSYPPSISQFSFQGAIYLGLLKGVFAYDESSWLVDEPGDWNLIRRMTAAGVTMAATEDTVAYMNQIPYTHKDDE